ncbi:hypothetical protein [Actinokineospora sp. NBRC 105648]|uniref:hypothetical protein n=1 Tax=Actinokineospora sp. NBRC 105648 TaxID=3032206 RepID=UPI0024A37B04|nr:hypothetical protein [Actinokineospora sp. NBRC 105648]GLZ42829.1 hypothetical protein Acsp05_64530 [Actinokineospora sp. NBRC 105648]
MPTTLDARPFLWGELTRLSEAAHAHLERHPSLSVASLDLFATGIGPGRVEIYVAGELGQACGHLLAWRNTLTHTSVCLVPSEEQPKAMLFGQLADDTSITVVAPLDGDTITGDATARTGDWELHWLRMHASTTP